MHHWHFLLMVKDHDFREMQLAGIPTKFEEN